MESKAAVAQQPDFVVHSFESAVAESPRDPRDDVIEVAADHLRRAFDGLYPRAHSAPQPSSEKLLGPCLGFVGVEVHEVVAQKHGAVEATISSHLLAEHPFVFRAAVVFGLEKGKLGVLEVASGSPFELAHQLAPGLIHGLVQMLDDVEAVKDHPCLRSLFADDSYVRLPHVHADRFELRGSLWSELAEKPQQRLGLALLSRPDDPAAEMVYYHC